MTKKEIIALGDVLFGVGGKVSVRSRSSVSTRFSYKQGRLGMYNHGRVSYNVNIYASTLDELAMKMKHKVIQDALQAGE